MWYSTKSKIVHEGCSRLVISRRELIIKWRHRCRCRRRSHHSTEKQPANGTIHLAICIGCGAPRPSGPRRCADEVLDCSEMGGRGVDARMRLAARHDVEHEPVELGLAQRIRSFPFNRILTGEARA